MSSPAEKNSFLRNVIQQYEKVKIPDYLIEEVNDYLCQIERLLVDAKLTPEDRDFELQRLGSSLSGLCLQCRVDVQPPAQPLEAPGDVPNEMERIRKEVRARAGALEKKLQDPKSTAQGTSDG